MEKTNRQLACSAAVLKHTAILLMFINHLSVGLFWNGIWDMNSWFYDFQWALTRGSFLLFAFQIAEGMVHTHDRKAYLLRLFGMAIVSEYFFDELFMGGFPYWRAQNVFFTLFLGGLAIALLDRWKTRPLLAGLSTAGLLALSAVFGADYGLIGVAVILLFYVLRDRLGWALFVVAIALFVLWFVQAGINCLLHNTLFVPAAYLHNAIEEECGLLIFPLILRYNGKKGRQLPKAFYYLFYPGHLLFVLLLVQLLR